MRAFKLRVAQSSARLRRPCRQCDGMRGEDEGPLAALGDGSVSHRRIAISASPPASPSTPVKERPILFSAPMVRALLDGRKTQTRRIVRPQPDSVKSLGHLGALVPYRRVAPPPEMPSATVETPIRCPYGAPGDRLWVREAHYLTDDGDYEQVVYAEDAAAVEAHLADVDEHERRWPSPVWPKHRKLRPSIHMPRWASRLTLNITGCRIERLQDISEADAIAEGVWNCLHSDGRAEWVRPDPEFDTAINSARHAYFELWKQINGAESWAANPWAWVVTFANTPAQDGEAVSDALISNAPAAYGTGGLSTPGNTK